MSEKFRIPELPPITPERKARSDAYRALCDEIERIGATAVEIAQASLIAIDNPIEGTIREEVFLLAQKIKEGIEHGITSDDIENLIDDAYSDEHVEAHLEDTLTMFGLSEEQQDMVMNIFNEKKTGRLVVYDRESRKELGSTAFVEEDVKDPSKVRWKLIGLLGAHPAEEVDLVFTKTESV